MRALALPVVLLLLAGCTGGGEPEAETANVSTQGAADAAPEADPTRNATEEPGPEPLMEISVPFSYSGTTPGGLCGPAGCVFPVAGSEDFHAIEHRGAPTKIVVDVAYRDQLPGMSFYVGVCTGAGASEAETACRDYVTGASPIHAEFDLSQSAAGTQVALSVGSLSTAAGPAGAMVFSPSSFDATGTLTAFTEPLH